MKVRVIAIYSKDLRDRAVGAVERSISHQEGGGGDPLRLPYHPQTMAEDEHRAGRDLESGVSTGRRRRILTTLRETKALQKHLEENDKPPWSAIASFGSRRRALGCLSTR